MDPTVSFSPEARRRAWLAMAASAAALTACSMPPKPSVKDAYLAMRLSSVDPAKPCYMRAHPPSPVKLVHRRLFMPVVVNGIQTIGVVDTGAAVSLITPELAEKAGVTSLKAPTRLSGVAGSFVTQTVLVNKLQLGTIVFSDPRVAHVFPFAGSSATDIGAQIGLDWLSGFDYDMDLPHEKFRAYSTQNCITVDPPWRNSYTGLVLGHRGGADAMQIASLAPLSFAVGAITIPVTFEGSTIDAEFDTGSTDSLLSHDAALDAGVKSSQLRADKLVSAMAINGHSREVYEHKFADLAIGEEEIRNFPIAVTKHFDRRDTPMLLGMDYIARHHLWLSLTTDALYIDSGEARKPTPPLDEAHRIAGTESPDYPDDAKGEKGHVQVRCTVQADGSLKGCAVINDGGHKALGAHALTWLTGDNGPIMQPAYRNGKPVNSPHDWDFDFAP
jgi:predicted aspartyl protease